MIIHFLIDFVRCDICRTYKPFSFDCQKSARLFKHVSVRFHWGQVSFLHICTKPPTQHLPQYLKPKVSELWPSCMRSDNPDYKIVPSIELTLCPSYRTTLLCYLCSLMIALSIGFQLSWSQECKYLRCHCQSNVSLVTETVLNSTRIATNLMLYIAIEMILKAFQTSHLMRKILFQHPKTSRLPSSQG